MIRVPPDKVQNIIARNLITFIKDNNPTLDKIVFTPKVMISFLNNIHEVRNICAHNGRLIYFKCRSDATYYPLIHMKYSIDKNDERRSVYATFILMECFLTRTEFAILNNTIRKRMRRLRNHIYSISVNDVIGLLGFPEGWYDNPPLQ